MDGELLIRTYNVGFGECMFVHISDKSRDFRLLIDCGTSGKGDALQLAIANLRDYLSAHPRRGEQLPAHIDLDVVVATHLDQDHVKGFNPKIFEGLRIGQIWLPILLMKEHPQASQATALVSLADLTARASVNLDRINRLVLGENVREQMINSLTKSDVLAALRGEAPDLQDNLDPTSPRIYLSREPDGDTGTAQLEQLKKHGFTLEKNVLTFRPFHYDPSTAIRILAPEWDIDGLYLGRGKGLFGAFLKEFGTRMQFEASEAEVGAKDVRPDNISQTDFRGLRSGLLSSALRFSWESRHLQNNTSIVLLIEWRNQRLLFPADAEWSGRGYQSDHQNSSWDIMLEKANEHLLKPLSFLKVGHHGSVNGTPYKPGPEAIQTILDQLCPVSGQSQMVVSTHAGYKHAKNHPIPDKTLLHELGKRCTNARCYSEDGLERQPPRTDLENRPWIDVKIKPG